jgi:hypothetical protein
MIPFVAKYWPRLRGIYQKVTLSPAEPFPFTPYFGVGGCLVLVAGVIAAKAIVMYLVSFTCHSPGDVLFS